jgi:regulator of protease activity HflC (stomatin/prohibitin superfamily)
MESRINYSIGVMEEAINRSEGEKQRRINEAEGTREEILALARATAGGLRRVAEAVKASGGEEAVVLRITEQYIAQLHKLARAGTHIVLPMNLADFTGVLNQVRALVERREPS